MNFEYRTPKFSLLHYSVFDIHYSILNHFKLVTLLKKPKSYALCYC